MFQFGKIYFLIPLDATFLNVLVFVVFEFTATVRCIGIFSFPWKKMYQPLLSMSRSFIVTTKTPCLLVSIEYCEPSIKPSCGSLQWPSLHHPGLPCILESKLIFILSPANPVISCWSTYRLDLPEREITSIREHWNSLLPKSQFQSNPKRQCVNQTHSPLDPNSWKYVFASGVQNLISTAHQ